MNDQDWPQTVMALRPTFFEIWHPLRGYFLSAAFCAAAGYFLLLRQKKVSKEKATRRRKNSRANCRHPGAAHPLRSKEDGLFPGWRQFSRLAPTGMGALLRCLLMVQV